MNALMDLLSEARERAIPCVLDADAYDSEELIGKLECGFRQLYSALQG